MLTCTVKFCGGCNPRYDRGGAYRRIVAEAQEYATFSSPTEGVHYDVLLIVRGCTCCPYLYEEIDADHRIICTSEQAANQAAAQLRTLA